ncbi:hypothetical protein D4765_14525 [Subtercola vilae]|uniref:Uncharacterized protein n=1 Tax=Subtercola vilae TaxID=2056433 RepID=A0A4V4RG05_9MICO|nr:hypothetical protein D4765_14525 [Subtercola vilae]
MFAVRDPAESFEVNRNAFAWALKASNWFRAKGGEDYTNELWQLWDEIKDADDVDHFDAVLDALYDLADEDRCWIRFEAPATPEETP